MICYKCNVDTIIIETPNLTHYAKEVCPKCNKWFRWIREPNKKIPNRNGTSKINIESIISFHGYSYEFCFFCLRTKEQLGICETMTIDHIQELSKGGTDNIENLQILCSGCHKLKNWARLYLNWHLTKKNENIDRLF